MTRRRRRSRGAIARANALARLEGPPSCAGSGVKVRPEREDPDGRGICPHCGDLFKLTTDSRIWKHGVNA